MNPPDSALDETLEQMLEQINDFDIDKGEIRPQEPNYLWTKKKGPTRVTNMESEHRDGQEKKRPPPNKVAPKVTPKVAPKLPAIKEQFPKP